MIGRIVSGRIWCKTARWTMLQALVPGQQDHTTRPCQPSVIEHSGEISQYAWIFTPVTIKNLTNLVSHNGSFYRHNLFLERCYLAQATFVTFQGIETGGNKALG